MFFNNLYAKYEYYIYFQNICIVRYSFNQLILITVKFLISTFWFTFEFRYNLPKNLGHELLLRLLNILLFNFYGYL